MLLYWLTTIIFAATASMIAHAKGRNSLGWYLTGMVIGPFALIVAALPAVERDGLFVRCPSCREVIRMDADRCRYCRTRMTVPHLG